MRVVFESGSVNYYVAEYANLVIDVDTLPNPINHKGKVDLKLPGFHPAIQSILEANGQIKCFCTTAMPVVDRFLEQMRDNGATYVVIVFRCQGGLHRSVYCARHFAEHFAARYKYVRDVHPALGAEASTSPESSEDAPQSGSEQLPIMYTYNADTNTLHVQEVALQSTEDRDKMLLAGLDKIKERREQNKKKLNTGLGSFP